MTKIVRSSYDAKEFQTADEAFDAVTIENGTLFRVARFGFEPNQFYVIEAHRNGCAGFELYGYVGEEG